MTDNRGQDAGGRDGSRRVVPGVRALMLAIVPLMILAGFVLSAHVPGTGLARAAPSAPLVGGVPASTTVVVILDSLSEQSASDAGLMPHLHALAARALSGPEKSCTANFTTPCLMTVFEGRQSPFLASLHNFSAFTSTSPNYFAMLRDKGLRLAVLSDHTLTHLYPDTYVTGLSYDDLHIAMPDRDAFAFKQTFDWLDQKRYDALVIHVVGTDWAGHLYHPGTKGYAHVYRRADAFVGALASRLDLTRDNLVVFGDHGHGPSGDHDRKSWYVAAGPRIAKASTAIDQPSLLFLLAGLNSLPLPQTYEGNLPWTLFHNDGGWLAKWRRTIGAGWSLPAASATHDGLQAYLDRRLGSEAGQPLGNFLRFLPWWGHFVLVGAVLLQLGMGGARLPRGFVAFQCAWLLAAIATSWGWLAWFALAPQLWISRSGFERAPLLVLASFLAGLSGLLIPWIFDTFHSTSGFSRLTALWFAVFIGVPLLLGLWFRPFGPGSALKQGGLTIIACAAVLGTPGIYYYSTAQMIHVLLFPVALTILLLEVVLKRMRCWPLLLACLAGLPFMDVTAGGWDWGYILHHRLSDLGTGVPLAMGCAALAACWVMWRSRGALVALIAVGLLLADGWALVRLFDFELARVASFGLLLVCLTAALKIFDDAFVREPTSATTAWQVAIFAGLAFVTMWSATDGFFLKNLRFEFALNDLAGVATTETALAFLAGALVILKYALVMVPVVVAAAFALGRQRLLVIAPWIVLVFTAKVALQSVQLVGVEFVEIVKASELLIQEIAGFSFVTLTLWVCLVLVALSLELGIYTSSSRLAPVSGRSGHAGMSR